VALVDAGSPGAASHTAIFPIVLPKRPSHSSL
jgi:hypothetical protein